MNEDWFITSINRIEGSANELHAALDHVVDVLQDAKRQRLAGIALVEITKDLARRGVREARLELTRSFREFEHNVTRYRAATIRALVEEERMTFSAIAEMAGVSRQMIARLHRSAAVSEGVLGDTEDE
ncbi:MAG: hypothetical protein QOJ19_510 [Acidimicrobiia bacterium]|jgi:predicted HTH domain antitoxin|nr:hypothetical protein [Acidimicrobiia bacterium]